MNQGQIPLNLAVLEVRFPGDPLVETLRGEFYQKVRSDFPQLHVPNIDPNQAPALQPYRFASEDGGRWLLVALNAFAYGVSGLSYESFETFKQGWQDYFGAFREVYPNAPGMTRIGLRYLNHLPFARDVNDNIISSTVHMPTIGNLPARNSLFVTEKVIEGGLIRIVIDTTQEGLHPNEVLLDFDFFFQATVSSPIPFNDLDTHLETAHGVTKHLFQELVSEEYRKGVGLQ
jgi:uncharacterized protein (TIGR04255 family)